VGNAAMTFAGWDAAKHPRAAKGSAGGGQFAPLSYNAKSNTGTGYGSAKGDGRVLAAQKALNKAHMTDAHGQPLRLDGKLGPKTTAALKAYQKAHGLNPDGKITPKLLAALKKGGGRKPATRGAVHKKTALAKPAKPVRKVNRSPIPPPAHRSMG
jgi:peptidoglycan hydrolase-like protein with peptidoglycan-binding domain